MKMQVVTTPADIADALAEIAGDIRYDREMTAILQSAQAALAALAWNRYAESTSRRSKARQRARELRRRHQQLVPARLVIADSTPEDLAITAGIKAEIIAEMVGGRA